MYVCMYAYIHAMSVHLVFTYGLTYININYTHATYVMQDSPEVPSWLLSLFFIFFIYCLFFFACVGHLWSYAVDFFQKTLTHAHTHTHTQTLTYTCRNDICDNSFMSLCLTFMCD